MGIDIRPIQFHDVFFWIRRNPEDPQRRVGMAGGSVVLTKTIRKRHSALLEVGPQGTCCFGLMHGFQSLCDGFNAWRDRDEFLGASNGLRWLWVFP